MGFWGFGAFLNLFVNIFVLFLGNQELIADFVDDMDEGFEEMSLLFVFRLNIEVANSLESL